MKNLFKKLYYGSFIFQWLLFFIPPVFVIIGMSIYYYHTEKEKLFLSISTHESSIVDIGANTIEQELSILKSDLVFLTHHYDLKKHLNNVSKGEEHFTENYILMMRSRGLYDQIRWIDENGKERVRLDWRDGNPTVIEKEKLQDKSNRYYFTESVSLPDNSLYFSPFDLNIENEKVEIPYKPMIRVATPLYDNNGIKRGVFVINYLGSKLLNELDTVMSMSQGEKMLLNRDGYWLRGSKNADEWGFMFNLNDLRLSHTQPDVWQHISQEEQGQFENEEGLWTFKTFYPLSKIKSTNQTDKTLLFTGENKDLKTYKWHIVTFVPSEKLYYQINEQRIIMIIIIALLISGFGSWRIVDLYFKDKMAQEKIRKFSAIIEQIDDYVVVVDRDGTINYINPAFLKHSGYSIDEVIGKTPRIFKSGRHDKAFYQSLWKKILSSEVYHGTVINKKKNGETYYENKTITPLCDNEEKIIGFVSTGRDVTEESLLNQEIKYFATVDALTGLYNRHKFKELFALEAERFHRFANPLSLMVIDIDNFKMVNDNYGHIAGDEVLKTLARVIQENIRKIDIAARWGGEEFLVLCPNTNLENIMIFAEKLRLIVEATSFYENIPITVSSGVAIFKSEDKSFSDLFKRADFGLYSAKENGRNRVCYLNS